MNMNLNNDPFFV